MTPLSDATRSVAATIKYANDDAGLRKFAQVFADFCHFFATFYFVLHVRMALARYLSAVGLVILVYTTGHTERRGVGGTCSLRLERGGDCRRQ